VDKDKNGANIIAHDGLFVPTGFERTQPKKTASGYSAATSPVGLHDTGSNLPKERQRRSHSMDHTVPSMPPTTHSNMVALSDIPGSVDESIPPLAPLVETQDTAAPGVRDLVAMVESWTTKDKDSQPIVSAPLPLAPVEEVSVSQEKEARSILSTIADASTEGDGQENLNDTSTLGEKSGSVSLAKNALTDACDSVVLSKAVKSHPSFGRSGMVRQYSLRHPRLTLNPIKLRRCHSFESEPSTSRRQRSIFTDSAASADTTSSDVFSQKSKDRSVSRHASERRFTVSMMRRRRSSSVGNDGRTRDVSPKKPVKRSSLESEHSRSSQSQYSLQRRDQQQQHHNVVDRHQNLKPSFSDNAYAASIEKYLGGRPATTRYDDKSLRSRQTIDSTDASSVGMGVVKGKFRRVLSCDSLELLQGKMEEKKYPRRATRRSSFDVSSHCESTASSMNMSQLGARSGRGMPQGVGWASMNVTSTGNGDSTAGGNGSSSALETYNRWSSSV